ncbi:putative calmodulin-like protein 6 [Exaiptasia diaphana]|uniref:EF-hand domain-containing protein n=1 Tax=Exaiptasia diaphana TaxID=2652724 RepID=A0A913WQ02_EXADI|nr:putative calmodulin-like protein 6 [Exaiptasia diaphana]
MAESNEVKIKDLFSKYEKDGCVDQAALTSLIKNEFKGDIDVDENQIETILMLLDQEGNRSVTFDQFYKWYCRDDKLEAVKNDFTCRLIQKAVQTFKTFDKNDNGTIERDELQHLLKSLSFDAKRQQNAFETLDKDKNGKISFPEFLSWLNLLPSLE